MTQRFIHSAPRGKLTGLPGQIRSVLEVYALLADPQVSVGRKLLIAATAAYGLYR